MDNVQDCDSYINISLSQTYIFFTIIYAAERKDVIV
jgi:hypothetical protein